VCIEYTHELQRRRDAETRVSRRQAGMRGCSRVRAFFLFPSKIDGKAAGRRDRTVLIYKRRGMTLPIIKLAVLLSPRDREPCGESLRIAGSIRKM